MNYRYEIVSFDRQTFGSRAAGQCIVTGLRIEDVLARLKRASVDPSLILTGFDSGKLTHYFHDEDGQLCKLKRYTMD